MAGTLASHALVVVGSLNMDLVFRVPRAPDGGETVPGDGFAVVPGGKGANQAVACARLGSAVTLIGRVGADAFGRQILEALCDDGIDVGAVREVAGTPSGVAMVMVESSGQNRIVVVSGANALLTPAGIHAERARIEAAGLLVMQLEVPLETVIAAARVAMQARTPVLLNPAPARELPDEIWPLLDWLIPNETEASMLTGIAVRDPASAIAAARILRDRGVCQAVITLGAQGVVLADAAGERHFPANPVTPVDTTAAGDTFIGGLSTGLLEGLPVEEAICLGQKAAAICVSRHGAQPSIPYRSEL